MNEEIPHHAPPNDYASPTAATSQPDHSSSTPQVDQEQRERVFLIGALGLLAGIILARKAQDIEDKRADKITVVVLLAFSLAAALFFMRCSGDAKGAAKPATAQTSTRAPEELPGVSESPTALPELPTPCLGWPKRVAGLFDQSASTTATRTEHPRVHDLDPLIDCTVASGGELLLAAIRDRSNGTLVRLLAEPPPTPPERPAATDNAVIDYDNAAVYTQELAAYAEEYAAWQRRTIAAVAQFRRSASELLAMPADAGSTALAEAVTRAYVGLNEPTPFPWLADAERVLLIVSDGDHTASERVVPMPDQPTTIITVNGEGRRTDLLHLNPVPFESFASALRHLTGGRHVQ
jgi:hypothetical protein